jgi:hypothetical protein
MLKMALYAVIRCHHIQAPLEEPGDSELMHFARPDPLSSRFSPRAA